MKKICSLLVITSYLLMGCDKDNLRSNSDYVEVTVKLVDAVCNSAIFEIQEPSLKHHGESGFEYNGKVYSGVFYTSITCTNANLLSNQAQNPVGGNSSLFKILISKKLINDQPCDRAFCQAVPYKLPEKFYYVYNTGVVF